MEKNETTMMQNAILLATFILAVQTASAQDNPPELFSGPQVGEVLPSFKMKVALGGKPGTNIDFVAAADDSPVVVVFIHQLTRPGFALANAVMKYCQDAKDSKLHQGICFLSADPSQAQKQIDRAKRYFPNDTYVGYSMEGIEGPGSYGLNRNVQVTILVAKQKRVLANFALVQPGVHADGPIILEAIAKAIDAKGKPDINEYIPNNQAAQDTPIAIDPALMQLLRRLNLKDTDQTTVEKTISEIETLIDGKKALQQQLGSVVNRWIRSNQVDKIGTESQQKRIKSWARQYATPRSQTRNAMQPDAKLTGLLRNLIQKTNTDKQVDEAAKVIEEYIKDNKAAEAELKRISTTVAYGGKLENYGTKSCQAVLKTWADRFKDSK